ncbi:hypothetical protein [Terrimonas pollutisoli]|uniref:hypothetical protein n=1 Tax=Terrimonas pollutisoli TaxID=3034147 RepID=UPI0023EAD92E|nr:hypothetical protein [Terrimonas sp. H1YJ31]
MNKLVIIPVLEGRHMVLKGLEVEQLSLPGGVANRWFEIKRTKRTVVRLKTDNMVFLVDLAPNLGIVFF